jgi:hypothetical protein
MTAILVIAQGDGCSRITQAGVGLGSQGLQGAAILLIHSTENHFDTVVTTGTTGRARGAS